MRARGLILFVVGLGISLLAWNADTIGVPHVLALMVGMLLLLSGLYVALTNEQSLLAGHPRMQRIVKRRAVFPSEQQANLTPEE